MNEIGLTIVLDGKNNVVIGDGEAKEYPIGGVACEYARLHPHEIKKYITENSYFAKESAKEDEACALMELYDSLKKEYGLATATMIVTDFSNCLSEYGQMDADELKEASKEWNEDIEADNIKKFILQDTGYSEFGISTVGQALLTAYSMFAYWYVAFRHTFDILVADGSDKETDVETFWKMYGDCMEFQHIDFKIINYDGGFHSLYTIKSSLSLILFEAAHAIENKTNFVKCKNCGCYFVPVGRSNSLYCGYPSPQDEKKACRDIGANAAMAKKMKNDVLTQEYRRLYMRLKMALKRHPGEKALEEKLHELTEGMKIRRKQREEGSLSADSILEWLSAFDDPQKK